MSTLRGCDEEVKKRWNNRVTISYFREINVKRDCKEYKIQKDSRFGFTRHPKQDKRRDCYGWWLLFCMCGPPSHSITFFERNHRREDQEESHNFYCTLSNGLKLPRVYWIRSKTAMRKAVVRVQRSTRKNSMRERMAGSGMPWFQTRGYGSFVVCIIEVSLEIYVTSKILSREEAFVSLWFVTQANECCSFKSFI